VLKVVVELWPGGNEAGRRVIATAEIARVRNGALADYEVDLEERALGTVGDTAYVRGYARWSATVWDLVARCIVMALHGKEQLPPMPVLPDVPIHTSADGRHYVRLREIQEPTRSFFRQNLANSARPLVEDDPQPFDCAHADDWKNFLEGQR